MTPLLPGKELRERKRPRRNFLRMISPAFYHHQCSSPPPVVLDRSLMCNNLLIPEFRTITQNDLEEVLRKQRKRWCRARLKGKTRDEWKTVNRWPSSKTSLEFAFFDTIFAILRFSMTAAPFLTGGLHALVPDTKPLKEFYRIYFMELSSQNWRETRMRIAMSEPGSYRVSTIRPRWVKWKDIWRIRTPALHRFPMS